ncbi:hypothetical protein BD626DRAFT_638847 [Schizophyllum amplum]|uniref:Uncharacterized protein n=1 Tax=Schizophyllum amplum TaxID=97359 RepID=A0A550BRG6_9AGAR|nr:hypothetical protein BD626DRAFT_638847 [Auriculariopsis ampla]
MEVPRPATWGWRTRACAMQLHIEPTGQLHIEPPAPEGTWHKICVREASEVDISGWIVKRPAWCDRDGHCSVFDHWIVDHDEPESISSYAAFTDKARRRFSFV